MKKQKLRQAVDSNSVQDRVVNIHEMANSAAEQHLAQSYLNLEKKAIGLSQTIDQLLKELESKENKIKHLEEMLHSAIPNNIGGVIKIEVSDEELIADMQIKRLSDASRVRELTLDEIRKFDLLIKNKRLAKGDATTIEGTNLNKKQLQKVDLIAIASKKQSSEDK